MEPAGLHRHRFVADVHAPDAWHRRDHGRSRSPDRIAGYHCQRDCAGRSEPVGPAGEHRFWRCTFDHAICLRCFGTGNALQHYLRHCAYRVQSAPWSNSRAPWWLESVRDLALCSASNSPISRILVSSSVGCVATVLLCLLCRLSQGWFHPRYRQTMRWRLSSNFCCQHRHRANKRGVWLPATGVIPALTIVIARVGILRRLIRKSESTSHGRYTTRSPIQ